MEWTDRRMDCRVPKCPFILLTDHLYIRLNRAENNLLKWNK